MVKIIIDERIRHGKPIIEKTRITVDEVLGMLESGMSYKDIEKEYGIKRKDIIAVISYASSLVRGEDIHNIPA